MKIVVETSTGKKFSVNVDPALTSHHIKRKIEDYEGIPCDQQSLTFRGREIQDSQTLADCSVYEESTIQLKVSSSHNFEVCVQTFTDSRLVITVNPEHLVLSIKIKIKEKADIRIDGQFLIFGGQLLDDDRRIKDYGIQSGSSICLLGHSNPFLCNSCQQPFESQGDCAPLILSCGHSLCHGDVRALLEDAEKIACPVCAMRTDLNLSTEGFPPQNIALLESLERSREIWNLDLPDRVNLCSNCEIDRQLPATVFCMECCADLCDQCDIQVHTLKILRDHERMAVVVKPLQLEKCQLHREAMKRFCSDCKTPVCVNCVEKDGPHHDHNHRLMSTIVAEEKQQLRNKVAQCFGNLCDLQSLATDLQSVGISLEKNQEACLASFRADKEAIFAAMTARCDAIEQRLAADVAVRQCELMVQRKAITSGLCRTDACAREALAALRASGS